MSALWQFLWLSALWQFLNCCFREEPNAVLAAFAVLSRGPEQVLKYLARYLTQSVESVECRAQFSGGVPIRKASLSSGMPLFRRSPSPNKCLGIVLRNAFTCSIDACPPTENEKTASCVR